nr:hypothetical protein [Tanacetum cinerariifolium]
MIQAKILYVFHVYEVDHDSLKKTKVEQVDDFYFSADYVSDVANVLSQSLFFVRESFEGLLDLTCQTTGS